MRTKSTLVELKEAGDSSTGVFTGYASIFGNKDSYGDIVIPGAFTNSLKSYGEGGSGIPCYWSHDMADPMKCIGWTKSAVEDERGLKVTVQLDLDNPNGSQAYKLIKAGVVNQMSFAYEVLDSVEGKSEDNGWYTELRELKIFEVSLVQVGANQETELLDVKHRMLDIKEGSELNATAEEKLAKALQLVSEVLEMKDDSQSDGSSEEPSEVNAEEQETAKAEEQNQVKARTLSTVDIAKIKLDLLKGNLLDGNS